MVYILTNPSNKAHCWYVLCSLLLGMTHHSHSDLACFMRTLANIVVLSPRWVYRRLLGLGGTGENHLTYTVEAGIREVDGGQWHHRNLQDASRETDLSQGFR